MKQLGFFVIDRLETGNRIWGYRKKMHLSQEGLAGLLAGKGVVVSINSIGRWERGEVDISYEYASALSQIFGCPLYGGLVVYHLRGSEDERDQPVFHIITARTHIRDMRLFCGLVLQTNVSSRKYQPVVCGILGGSMIFYTHKAAVIEWNASYRISAAARSSGVGDRGQQHQRRFL